MPLVQSSHEASTPLKVEERLATELFERSGGSAYGLSLKQFLLILDNVVSRTEGGMVAHGDRTELHKPDPSGQASGQHRTRGRGARKAVPRRHRRGSGADRLSDKRCDRRRPPGSFGRGALPALLVFSRWAPSGGDWTHPGGA